MNNSVIIQILQRMENKIDKVDEKVDKLDKRVGKLEESVDKLDKRVGKLEESVGKLEEGVDKLEERVGKVEVVLENEIKTDIHLLVVGHKGITQSVEKGTKATSTVELNDYRFKLLERDMKKV